MRLSEILFETMEDFGNWSVHLSDKPVVMPAITGTTPQYVAKITHKVKTKKDPKFVFYGIGNSQGAARDNAFTKTKDNDRTDDPNKFKSFIIDLNVDFTQNYFDAESGAYFKITSIDNTPYLVMASKSFYKQFGHEIVELGFRRAGKRVEATAGSNAHDLFGFKVSPKEVILHKLIPNMRYTLKDPAEDNDGNLLFELIPDSRTLGPQDKYRMHYPGLTVAGVLK